MQDLVTLQHLAADLLASKTVKFEHIYDATVTVLGATTIYTNTAAAAEVLDDFGTILCTLLETRDLFTCVGYSLTTKEVKTLQAVISLQLEPAQVKQDMRRPHDHSTQDKRLI